MTGLCLTYPQTADENTANMADNIRRALVKLDDSDLILFMLIATTDETMNALAPELGITVQALYQQYQRIQRQVRRMVA
jgi:hypothetical protein